ncbi:type II secretion system protein N [Desulfolithobacter sp.]
MFRLAIKLLVIAALLYCAVLFFYSRLEQRMVVREAVLDQEKKQASISAEADAGPVRDMDYQRIVQRNIFQAAVSEPLPRKEKEREKPLETTSLKLELLGTVSGNERDARAIIVDEKEKRQDIYHVGDSVQGAIIEGIERGKVILRVGNRKEVLLLKDRESKKVADRPDIFDLPMPPPSLTRPSVRPRVSVPRTAGSRSFRFRQETDREVEQEVVPDSVFRAEEEAPSETVNGADLEDPEVPPVFIEVR